MGNNWDSLNTSGAMNDDDRDGIFAWEVLLPEGNWEYKVVLNQNWDQDTQGGGGNNSVSSDGSLSTVFNYDFRQNATYYNVLSIDCPAFGDVNGDGYWNVLDIVQLSNCILSNNCDDHVNGCAGDLNGDGYWNVLDIVILSNCILANSCDDRADSYGGRVDDATLSRLIMKDNMVSIEADGFIGGVQMTLRHGDDFRVKMTEHALLADYLTSGNETRLLVITPETDELFSYSGDFEITEIIVANSHAEVSVDMPLINAFRISKAYPNPFNPTTTMTLTMPMSGDITVEVYNLLGQSITTLTSGYKEAGTYILIWDATDAASGMYIVKAETRGSIQIQKLLLLK